MDFVPPASTILRPQELEKKGYHMLYVSDHHEENCRTQSLWTRKCEPSSTSLIAKEPSLSAVTRIRAVNCERKACKSKLPVCLSFIALSYQLVVLRTEHTGGI